MASAAKTTARILLTLGLVLGAVGSFLPTGEHWAQDGGVRDTETFTVFTYTFERTSGDALVREDVRGWTDDRIADDAGSTQMFAAGIVTVAALLLVVVGTILGLTSRASRAGGVVGVFGAVTLAAAVALAVLGMRARTEAVLGNASALDPQAGLFLLAGGFLAVLVGGVVLASLRRQTEQTELNPWEDYPAHVEAQNRALAQAEADARTLRCPECSTTVRAAPGVVPTCTSCGFHSRGAPAGSAYDAPAPDTAWA